MFVDGAPPYNLVDTASDWAKAEILSTIAKGFVPDEVQGNFTSIITRAEFCQIAVSFTEYALGQNIDTILSDRGLTRNPNAFTDTTDPCILAALALGITNGTKTPTSTTPGLFTPNGQFSRQEAATMLMRVCGVIGIDTDNPTASELMRVYGVLSIDTDIPPASDFTDINEADAWARDAINFVRAKGIMGGTSTTAQVFSPKDAFTRQESIVTFNRIWINEYVLYEWY